MMRDDSYRPEIDGLRAIAVMSVMLFHFQVSGFSGGFIGVDVFFVISGYLISRKIVTSLDAGTFSFAEFYGARARRILPALFVTLALTWIAGLVFLAPEYLVGLSRSLIFAAASVSNILFWRESGYFDVAAHLKPLLHTWSLSVEEQFYLVLPLLLVGLWKAGWARHALAVVLTLSLVSLLGAEVVRYVDQAAAFYLMPFRAVEFGVGAAIVWLQRLRMGRIANPMSLVGLAAIVVPSVLYTDQTPFPGATALVPCLGAAAIILAGTSGWAGRWLTHRAFVDIGRISYSLYLVHWPMVVFWRQLTIGSLGWGAQVGLILMTFVLAVMMFRFVEQPFRRRETYRVLSSGAGRLAWLAPVVLLAVSSTAWAYQGWPGRSTQYSDVRVRIDRSIQDPLTVSVCSYSALGCAIGAPARDDKYEVVLVGDSHADHWIYGLHRVLLDLNMSGLMISSGGGVPPLRVGETFQERDPVPKVAAAAFDIIDQADPAIVILSARWQLYASGTSVEGFKFRFTYGDKEGEQAVTAAADATVRYETEQGRRVLILGQIPYFGTDPLSCFAGISAFLSNASDNPNDMSRCHTYTRDLALASAQTVDALFKRVADKDGAKYVNFTDYLCTAGEYCDSYAGGGFLYKDDDHLNVPGAEFLARGLIAPVLSEMRSQ